MNGISFLGLEKAKAGISNRTKTIRKVIIVNHPGSHSIPIEIESTQNRFVGQKSLDSTIRVKYWTNP